MRVIVASDHGGFDLKEALVRRLRAEGHHVDDNGCSARDVVDYPLVAQATANRLLAEGQDFCILVCGTGIGMSIAANKVDGIRSALCSDGYSARMAKAHNNANVIALGGRTLGVELAWEIVSAFMASSFMGDVHQVRVGQIAALEGDTTNNGTP